MRPAPCHPDRPHVAKGLCKSCYNRRHNRSDHSPARSRSKKRANRVWRQTKAGRISRLLAQAKINGRERPFDLERSDIVIPSHCPVLGIPLDCAAEPLSDHLPSLDRIDNTKGYVKGNVWVISWRANRIKGDATHGELRALVEALDANMMMRNAHTWFKQGAS